MKLRLFIISVFLGLHSPATAQESTGTASDPARLTALDFLIQNDDLQGNTVEITDCHAFGTSVNSFLCSVSSESGNVGSIHVSVDDIPKKNLAYGFKKCAGLISNKNCIASVSGIAGKTVFDDAEIKAQSIKWLSDN